MIFLIGMVFYAFMASFAKTEINPLGGLSTHNAIMGSIPDHWVVTMLSFKGMHGYMVALGYVAHFIPICLVRFFLKYTFHHYLF